jgi:two-component system, OmpR family, alkaline phosphatase synthesis response regulator PhoP
MPSILIVEDDKIVSRVVERLLQRKGYTTQTIDDGKNAAAFINDCLVAPDLVLLDLMLPFVDGFSLLEMIRKSPICRKVPVIMLTSKGQETNILRAFDCGVDDYVVKPFNREELAARIKRQLKNNEIYI